MKNKRNKKSFDRTLGCLVSILAVLLIMFAICAGGMVWKIKDLNYQKAVDIEQQQPKKKEDKQNKTDNEYEAEEKQIEEKDGDKGEEEQAEETASGEEQQTAPVQQNATAYVLNANTKKVHFPDCRDVDRIAPQNRIDSNEPLEEILSQGYDPCGHCMD